MGSTDWCSKMPNSSLYRWRYCVLILVIRTVIYSNAQLFDNSSLYWHPSQPPPVSLPFEHPWNKVRNRANGCRGLKTGIKSWDRCCFAICIREVTIVTPNWVGRRQLGRAKVLRTRNSNGLWDISPRAIMKEIAAVLPRISYEVACLNLYNDPTIIVRESVPRCDNLSYSWWSVEWVPYWKVSSGMHSNSFQVWDVSRLSAVSKFGF